MGRLKKKFNLKLTPAEFEERVFGYFEETPIDNWTFASMYLYVGVSDHQWKRMAKKPEFRDAADYARMKMMDRYELKLKTGNPTGAIFGLKNMGWSDKAEIEMAVEGTVKVEDLLKGGKIRAR